MEETFTDKEFCEKLKIDRTTSLRWREQGIVGYLKLPNGQIRYLQRHIDALYGGTENLPAKNGNRPIKGGVVSISVAKRRQNGAMAENA